MPQIVDVLMARPDTSSLRYLDRYGKSVPPPAQSVGTRAQAPPW